MTQAASDRERIQQEVRSYLTGTFLKARHDQPLRDDEDLLKVLNSLQLLRMVIELESRFRISIENGELTPENLGTVERIVTFIERKRA